MSRPADFFAILSFLESQIYLKWTPNGPKIDPKWTQNGVLARDLLFNDFLNDLGRPFGLSFPTFGLRLATFGLSCPTFGLRLALLSDIWAPFGDIWAPIFVF